MAQNSWYSTVGKVLIGLLVIAGGYLGMQWLGSLKADPPKRDIPVRIKEVETRAVTNADLSATLDVQGRLRAYNKITLFTEVGGAVRETGKPFKQGTYFNKGQVLLRIDDEEARLNLQSQKATLLNAVAGIMPDLKIDYPESFAAWNDYLTDFDVNSPLAELPTAANQREKLFIAGRNLYTQYYAIKSLEDRLAKYTLYAPFSGVLTSTSIDEGAVVRPAQELGELMATGYYELVASVPLSELNYLQPGGEVRLYSEDIQGDWTGTVRRISDQIDPGTQTVEVYIGVRGRNLREGMYLRGEADARRLENVVEIDRDLLVDGENVYVVQDDTLLRQAPVVVRKFNRETVIISGLPDGTQLLTSQVAGAFDGMRVRRAGTRPRSESASKETSEDASVSK